MRARQTSRQAGRPPAAILLANAAAVAGQFGVMIFGNEVSAADAERRTRRVLLAPYGDWPNQRGLQRFQKEDAQNICNEFSSLAARVATPSSWLGIPWYEGHPDHPDFKGKPGHTRPVAVGRIKKLEAGNEGLWAEVRFNDDGERLISNESYHGHSVNWYMLPDAKDKRAFRPFSLKSVGFTNEPNIPVPAVTTANEAGGRELRFQHMAKLRAAGYGKAQSAANNWSDAAREAALEARRAHMKHAEKLDVLAKTANGAKLDAIKQSAIAHRASVAAHEDGSVSSHKQAARAHGLAADMVARHPGLEGHTGDHGDYEVSHEQYARSRYMARLRKK